MPIIEILLSDASNPHQVALFDLGTLLFLVAVEGLHARDQMSQLAPSLYEVSREMQMYSFPSS